MSEDEEKVKLRRLEPAIQKFIKIVIPTDLERLRKHQINIEKVGFFIFYHKKQLQILIYTCAFQPNLEYQIRGFGKPSISYWFSNIHFFHLGFWFTSTPHIPFLGRDIRIETILFKLYNTDILGR